MDYVLNENCSIIYRVYKDVDTFTIPDRVTMIADEAFFFKKIKTVIAPNVKTINQKAFKYSNIENIIIPNVENIGSQAFCSCKNITHINAPALKSIGNLTFDSCFNLKSIDAPNLQEIGLNAFNNCDNLCYINSKLSLDQIKKAFYDLTQYNNYIQRNRDYKLNKLEYEI